MTLLSEPESHTVNYWALKWHVVNLNSEQEAIWPFGIRPSFKVQDFLGIQI